MPELPEVETVVRTLMPQITGKRVSGATVLLSKTVQGETGLFSLLKGGTIRSVRRRAKLLLLSVEVPGDAPAESASGHEGGISAGQEIVLAFHLKMTGSFFVHPPDTPPLKHTRLVFDLEDERGPAGRLFFDDSRTFGYCRIMRPQDLDSWPFWQGLGPEPLEGSVEALADHFTSVLAGRRGAIKGLLLDQGIVAGVGNIYADESLHRAGIRPDVRADSLGRTRLLRLAKDLRDILNLSIRECGSSIRDYRDANGDAGAFQNSFAVYGRKRQPCRSCGAILEGTRIAGRTTVFCPGCQK